ncbi:MAG: hypothetical protein EBU43_01655 [Actinobacteria bacterium]|nr:hypothetical protein [Actinomycetota bacterium]
MRIASWNVLHGLGIPDGRYDQARLIANAAIFKDMDLVALQEVDLGQPRTQLDDQAELIGEAMGLPYRAFSPALFGTPGEKWQSAPHESPHEYEWRAIWCTTLHPELRIHLH